MWRYEIWDDQNLIEMRRHYFTEEEAQEAGTTALRAMQDAYIIVIIGNPPKLGMSSAV